MPEFQIPAAHSAPPPPFEFDPPQHVPAMVYPPPLCHADRQTLPPQPMTPLPPPARREIFMEWNVHEAPPAHIPALTRHGMDADMYSHMAAGIAGLAKSFHACDQTDAVLDYFSAGSYEDNVLRPQMQREWLKMSDHLAQLNHQWQPHGLTFNKVYRPQRRSTCTLASFSADCAVQFRSMPAQDFAYHQALSAKEHFRQGVQLAQQTPIPGLYVGLSWNLAGDSALYDPALTCFGMAHHQYREACQRIEALQRSYATDESGIVAKNGLSCCLYYFCGGSKREDTHVEQMQGLMGTLNKTWGRSGLRFSYIRTLDDEAYVALENITA